MRQIIYAMRFNGRAEPVSADGAALTASAAAPSSVMASTIGPAGLASVCEPRAGDEARFASEVTFTGATSFQERGSIAFGETHRLAFSTVGSGYLGAGPDAGIRHGTVMWRVDGGEGQFTGATGLITSNFTVDADRAITDHQFGVLWLPDADSLPVRPRKEDA